MLFNDLKNIPTFSGNENEDAAQWLKDITDALNYAGFPDDHKVSFICGYLEGDARRWLFLNVSVVDSLSKFIQEFKNMFVPTLLKEYTVSQVNEYEYVPDKMMMFHDNYSQS